VFDIEKINDSVWVFKNAIKDSQDIIEHFEQNHKWTDWYTFGNVINIEMPHQYFDSFPTEEEWYSRQNNSISHPIEKNINNLFYETTKKYIEENNIQYPSWHFEGWNIAKYNPQPETEYAMMYHTDFQREFAANPGSKFGVTAVFYLNDNYEGGEIIFRFFKDDSLKEIEKDFSYKPSKGDILVFPSGPPHFHGVLSVKSGEKYIIRNYWKYSSEGDQRWLDLKSKYGDSEWAKMEEDRLKYIRKNIININQTPKYMTFSEYYDKFENGNL
jgi:hypothetical protein